MRVVRQACDCTLYGRGAAKYDGFEVGAKANRRVPRGDGVPMRLEPAQLSQTMLRPQLVQYNVEDRPAMTGSISATNFC